jgi:iron uptake system component EfeO
LNGFRVAMAGFSCAGFMLVGGAGAEEKAGATASPIVVDVTDSSCEPSELTARAGRVIFSIHNASSRPLEWEILDGVMVVEERENIPPGSVRDLTAKLAPGDYQITCGLLNNPKGSLHVTGVDGASAKPSLVDLIGPLAEYRVYLSYEIDGLVDDTRSLVDAMKSGDFNSARALYSVAHAHYARIAPVAVFFPDLDGMVDSSVGDHDGGTLDLDSAGFRQLQWDLFRNAEPRYSPQLADKLVADVVAVQARFENLAMTPAPTITGAVAATGGLAPDAIGGETDKRTGSDLSDVQAIVEGVHKIVDLFRPLIAKADGGLSGALDNDFAALDARLVKYRNADGMFALSASLSSEDRRAMRNTMKALTGDLSRIAATLGFG